MATTTIIALDRGGFACFGAASADGRGDRVQIRMGEGEERPLSVDLGSAISSVAIAKSSGLSATSPVISGATFTASLSGAADGGYVEFLAELETGEVRRVPIDAIDPSRGGVGSCA